MKYTIALFGITKEIVGKSSTIIETAEPADVQTLLEVLKNQYPKLAAIRSLLVAINSEYANGQQVVEEHDEIALIPPVSGG